MLPLFLKNLSFCPPSSSSQVRKSFTRFQVCEFSSYDRYPPPPPQPPTVSVWWDLDSCPVPSGVSFWKIAPSIMAAVRANGIMGTICIRAYYDDFNSSKLDKEALDSTNITLCPIRSFVKNKTNKAEKNRAYKHLLMDLNHSVSQDPPPKHLFLIFGNEDVASIGILHRLRMRNYNILLACPGRAHVALCHAATIMWEWSSMLKGDLTGKHFNHPPDGPINSWYENSNVPLKNPFSIVELHTSSQNAQIYKPSLDIKLGETSISVSMQVMKILCSHANGISMGDLRAELTKCDLPLGKRFYGHKKFSNFLVSIPHVQLQYLGEGSFWVRLVPSTTSAVKKKKKDGAATQKLLNRGKNMDRSADEIPKISSSYVSSEGDVLKSFQSIPSQGKPIGEYMDGKSSFPSFIESNVHQPPDELQKTSLEVDVARALLPHIQPPLNDYISKKFDNDIVRSDDASPKKLFEDSKLSEVDQSASHFEEPESSELQQDLSPPSPPHCDNSRVLVWWDFDTCGVPSDISFLNVAPSIMGVLRANGIKGPIDIDAYGDVSQLSEIKQEALFLSGIDLHHIPGGKNKNKCFMNWVYQNPPKAHLFLISGYKDFEFSSIVHNTWWRLGSILLACPGRADGYVCKAANIVWQWSSVLKGKYLTGKYFRDPAIWCRQVNVPLQYPPEWYRNSKVPHENLFSAAEELTSSQNAEIHEPSSYIKLVEVPKSVSRQVRKILSSYPNGISIEDLHLQLRLRYGAFQLRMNRAFAAGFYGREKFSNFYGREEFSNILVSIPHVQLLYIGEDNFCVRLIPSATSNVKNKQRAVENEQRDVNHLGMPVLFSTGSFWDVVESFVFTSKGSHLLSTSNVNNKQGDVKNEHRDVNHSGMPVLFSTGFFWDDVESFVFTSRGSRLLSRSRSREDLAHRLQKHGPLFFMCLTENNILQLVKLLIAEKKWLEESPSQAFPFRLAQSVQKS